MKARLALLSFSLVALVAARPPMRYQPDPSSVIAAEIAFNRLVKEKGQWTAFRETAADDAILFMPEKILASQWLKGRADPGDPANWTPSVVYVSCDGMTAASTGNWTQANGTSGYFTTIWRRDKKGQWKWIMDHFDALPTPREAPEFLTGKVATCKQGARPDGPPSPPPGGKPGKDAMMPPPDESLMWDAHVTPDGGRTVMVKMWNGSSYDVVIADRVGPQR